MKELEISDDIIVYLEEISDGEAISIIEEEDGEITEKIILIRRIALEVAKKILELLGDDEETEE